MSCSCDAKNQTHKDVAKYVQKNAKKVFDKKSPSLGVGLFLVPAPDVGILENKVVYADNISYTECEKRGANSIAFQWIPNGFPVSIDGKKKAALKSGADLRGNPHRCTLSYCYWGLMDCPAGCFCNGMRCSYPTDNE